MISIIDLDSDGKVNILEFDKMLRDYHRKLLGREEGASDDSDTDDLKSISLVFSPSRVSTKCEHCLIGMAEPPKERNPKYDVVYVDIKRLLASFTDTFPAFQCQKTGWVYRDITIETILANI